MKIINYSGNQKYHWFAYSYKMEVGRDKMGINME